MSRPFGSGAIGEGAIGADTASGSTVVRHIGDGTFGSGTYGGDGNTSIPAVDPPRLKIWAPPGTVDALAIDRSGDVINLSLLDGTLVRTQPGRLRVGVGNGTPGATIRFYLDGQQVDSGTLDSVGRLLARYLTVDGLDAGDHTVGVGYDSAVTTLTFTTLTSALPSEQDPLVVEPPAAPVNRWTLQSYYRNDQGLFDSYTLPRNPVTFEQVFGSLAVSSEPTTAGGRILSWEGAPVANEWTFTGHVFDQGEYEAMRYWGVRNRKVYLTTHFNERFRVAVNGIEFQRVRDAARPWHQTYTMHITLLPDPQLVVIGPRRL